MSEWLNTETGEVIEVDDEAIFEQALSTAEAETALLHAAKGVARAEAKARRAEAQIERDKVKHRDKAAWTRILERWQATFPDKKITAKGYKSARATAVFLRLEQLQESMPDSEAESVFMVAIAGAQKLPYVVYGKRRSTGAKGDAAVDLADIASVSDDRKFDSLVEAGTNGGS